jgi:SAM-dependent methyltransferase
VTKTDKTEIREDLVAGIKNFTVWAQGAEPRMRPAAEIPEFVQKKAALISAHFLLPAGARVVDMGCGTGEVTYALAKLNPRWGIIGFDRDPKIIKQARENFRLPNLTFRVSDASAPDLEDGSIDGIINSNVLHHIYSESGYNQDEVALLLEKQIRKLKNGGTMLIRDYMMPSESEYVLLELPNVPSQGDDPASLSDADLLVLFSQTARPMINGCEGFFIEEQMPRREGTRLFRLPHKWAVEFIHRKNYREKWEKELKLEYTFFNYQDYRREFARFGMRMMFSAPYWNPWVVKNSFKGRFQMYQESGAPLQAPPTNYFIVAQKVADRQSLILEERRPSQKPVGDLQIMIVRDKKSGALHELVKRPGEYCDVVPYRITPDNRLVIYVRSGYPRPIVNAVSRGSCNLDGKRWSGHLIEPVTMDTVQMGEDVEENRKMIFEHVQAYTGLRPKTDESWFVGETYFPSPDRIDEAIEPVFIEVENPYKTTWPIAEDKDVAFVEPGTITELDAADIILASQVGLLPEPRLEMHVFGLLSKHGIPLPSWVGERMPEIPVQKIKVEDPDDILAACEPAEFEDEKKGAINLKAVKAVFVEEGKVGRGTRGLSAQDVEFIVTEDGIENIAIVLPVSRDWDDNLLVALDPQILPVPNRIGGDGAMLNAPSFVLPKDVRNIEEAKMFIADKFNVPVEQVASLGESYFTHTGVTPQRVYPFMVAAAHAPGAGRPLQFVMMKRLWKLWHFVRLSNQLMKMMTRMQMMTDENNDMSLNRSGVALTKTGYSLSTEKIAVEAKNTGYSAVPSRILGQRGGTGAPGAPKQDIDPALAAESKAAQTAVETIAAPRIGKRLMDSYSQAKKGLTGSADNISMKETPAMKAVDTDIAKVGMELKKIAPEIAVPKPPAPVALTLDLQPPTTVTGKGRR